LTTSHISLGERSLPYEGMNEPPNITMAKMYPSGTVFCSFSAVRSKGRMMNFAPTRPSPVPDLPWQGVQKI